MRYEFDDPDTFNPMDDYTHKDDMPDLESIQEWTAEIYKAVYYTGDVPELLNALDELMAFVDLVIKDDLLYEDAQIMKKPTPLQG